MSSTAGGADGGGLGWSHPWSQLADASAHRVGTVVAVVIALVVTGWLLGPEAHDILALLASIIGLAWMITRRRHDRREHLCLRCVQAIPTDPGAALERGRVWLWLHHRLTESPAWIAGYSALIVFALLPSLLRWRAIDWMWILPLAAMAWLSFHHRRLRPWCPYCRDWDDHGEQEPSPDPTGTKTSQR